MTGNSFRLTPEEREVLAGCVRQAFGLWQIAVVWQKPEQPAPDMACSDCQGSGRVESSLADGTKVKTLCRRCDGSGHDGNTALGRKVEVARRLYKRLTR